MSARLNNPAPRHFDDSGLPVSEGVLTFHSPLTTSLKDVSGSVSSKVLSESGMEPDYTTLGDYRVTLQTSAGVQLWSRDNVDDVDSSAFQDWNASTVYGSWADNIVVASDGNYYISIESNNLNNEPSATPDFWQESAFIPIADASYIGEIGAITPDQNLIIFSDEWEGLEAGEAYPSLLNGLGTQNGPVDLQKHITVAPGACSGTNGRLLVLESSWMKTINGDWEIGTGEAGLADGAATGVNIWYHVFVVQIDDEFIDVMIDDNITCANGTANHGVTSYRRIASVFCNSPNNLQRYFQYNDYFFLQSPPLDYAEAAPGDTAVLVETSAPTDINSDVILLVYFLTVATNGDAILLLTDPTQTDTTPSSSNYTMLGMEPDTGTWLYKRQITVGTNEDAEIRYRFAAVGAADLTISTLGWIDRRL